MERRVMDADALRRLAGATGFDVATLEKDYALSWLIHGIYTSPLAEQLAFKGGTAIRKIYAPEWRLSEDLDFTALADISPRRIEDLLRMLLLSLETTSGMGFRLTRFHGKPYYVQARIQFSGPLGHRNTIKVDVSLDERLVTAPVQVLRPPEYDIPETNVLVYSPEEILVEKLRSILQRGYARDYYDVWRLMREREFEPTHVLSLLARKCASTGVDLDAARIFAKDRLEEAHAHWDSALARLTLDLPPFDRVVRDLEKDLRFLAG